MSDPIVLDEFADWYADLDEKTQEDVRRSVDLLANRGVQLGFPQCSDIKNTKKYPIRELRIQSGGKPLRVLYAFNASRDSVIILGGLKQDDRFYEQYVPRAESLFEEYLRTEAQEG